jgi:hypothetical protein
MMSLFIPRMVPVVLVVRTWVRRRFLGNQKETNYALEQIWPEEFIKEVTDGLLPPAYFGMNVAMNKKGYRKLWDCFEQWNESDKCNWFWSCRWRNRTLILDTRKTGLSWRIYSTIHRNWRRFAPWVGALVGDVKQPIILVTEIGWEEESNSLKPRRVWQLNRSPRRRFWIVGKSDKEIDNRQNHCRRVFKKVEMEKARLSMYVKTLSIAQNMLKKLLANL